MNIALVLYAEQLGGHELMSIKLAKKIADCKKNITIFYPAGMSHASRFLDELDDINSKEYNVLINTSNSYLIKFIARSWRRLILTFQLKSNYDYVINCQGSFEQNWIFSFFCRLSHIKVASYVPYTSYPSERGAKLSRLRDYIHPFLLRLNLKYIVIHKFYKNHLIEEFNIKPSAILVIDNEVSIRKTDHNSRKIAQVNDIKFVLPGRFYFPQKGQDILVNSLKMLSGYKLDAKFLFIGDGPDKHDLNNLIKLNGLESYCKISPWTEDANEIYESADCILLPSRYEGVSLVMLESILLNKPIIASKLDINAFFIKEDFLFKVNDSLDLKSKILYMYSLLKNKNWEQSSNFFSTEDCSAEKIKNDITGFF